MPACAVPGGMFAPPASPDGGVLENALCSPESIGVYVIYTSASFSGGFVYAPASGEQMREISGLLAQIDLDDFEEYGGEYIGAGVKMLVGSGGESYTLAIARDADYSYIQFAGADRSEGEKTAFRAPHDAIPDFTEIYDAAGAVLRNRDDADNCAVVSVLTDYGAGFGDAGESYTLMKASTAIVKNVLDGTAFGTETARQQDTDAYDLSVVIGGDTYLLNSTAGMFTVNGEGAYLLDETWRGMLPTYLKN